MRLALDQRLDSLPLVVRSTRELFDFCVQLDNSFVRLLHPTVSLRQLQLKEYPGEDSSCVFVFLP